jgi:valine dehydrogenase (NAD+)
MGVFSSTVPAAGNVAGGAARHIAGQVAGDVAAESAPPAAHEQVVFCQDPATGLRAIIAIYSTALGPALGGTRFHPYESEEAALADALDLSRAMAYKNSLAGLDHGGGKAVIWGDPDSIKSEALLRAYGRFIESLGGRYYTACDVGTYTADMDIVARETRFVTGRSVENGGCGDSSLLTAYGVFQGMRAAAEHVWGSPTLTGRRVGIAGVGKVGRRLVDHLISDGASVVVTDVNEQALTPVLARYPQVDVVADTAALITSDIDVYAPCALGGALNDDTVPVLRATIVAGVANNQLAYPGVEKLLEDRGILYAPDYVVNAGGVIQVADEINGFNVDRARARAAKIFDTTKQILELAAGEGVPPAVAADLLAERRMAEVGRLRTIRLNYDR